MAVSETKSRAKSGDLPKPADRPGTSAKTKAETKAPPSEKTAAVDAFEGKRKQPATPPARQPLSSEGQRAAQRLGISDADIDAWFNAPPGTPLPPSVDKAMKALYESTDIQREAAFFRAALPLFEAHCHARLAQAGEADMVLILYQAEWATAFSRELPVLVERATERWLVALTRSSRYHASAAEKLRAEAATAPADKRAALLQKAKVE